MVDEEVQAAERGGAAGEVCAAVAGAQQEVCEMTIDTHVRPQI